MKISIKITLIILAVLLLGLGTTVYFLYKNYTSNLNALDASSEYKLSVTIEKGMTAKGVSLKLKRENIIKNDRAFEWYMRLNNLNDKIQTGTYRLSPALSIPQIAEMLTKGKVETSLLRILPGKRIDEIRQLLLDEGFSEQEVARALDSSSYKEHPVLAGLPKSSNLEGYIYPESYQKTAETSAETIVRVALNELQKQISPELQGGFVKQGLSLHQAIIIASIIEKEVDNKNDKPIVAQVFLKRFRIGMQLGSDVTAFYGSAIAGKPELQDVFFDSPYNTRIYNGLPPGPISNVGVASLQAVANPASTDYLYFVAGDDHITYFSKTLAEHEALTREHCKKLCGR